MPLTSNQKLIYDMCIRELPLSTARLSDEYYYNSIVFCLIDAIYSISAYYPTVSRTVQDYCERFHLARLDLTKKRPLDTHTINDFINNITPFAGTDYGASEIYHNRQRTSTRNGILKAEAVYQEAKILKNHNINTIADFRACTNIGAVENDFKTVKGQHSGISFSYLLMLSGDDNYIKTDRMLLRFVRTATHATVLSLDAVNADLRAVCANLVASGYTDLTPRLLDHVIWEYSRENL